MADITTNLPAYLDPRTQQQSRPLYGQVFGQQPVFQGNGASGSFDVPAMAAPAPAAAAAPAPAAPAAPAAAAAPKNKARAAMPAGAQAPVVPNQQAPALVPGETGFVMSDANGDRLVPYGTRFNVSGGVATQIGGGAPGAAGGGLYDGLPGGGKMVNGKFADPRDALEVGFRLQSQYRDESMRRILDLAGSGAELGYRARVGALSQAFGQNNFGATSVGGANALNSAIAHITGAGIGAGAQAYAAELGLQGREEQIGESARQFDQSPAAIGQRSLLGPGGIPLGTETVFGTRPGAPAYTPVNTERKPTYQEGQEYVDKAGNRATYKNGKFVPAK